MSKDLENLSEAAKSILATKAPEGNGLAKSFETGYNIAGLDQMGASALRYQSLADDVKNLTYGSQEFTIYPKLARIPARSTAEQYSVQTGYGQSSSVTEPGIAPITDPSLHQEIVRMKYLSSTKRTSLVSLQVSNVKDPMQVLAESATMELLTSIEEQIFYGNADLSATGEGDGLQFNGLSELTDDSNIMDLRGGVLTEPKLNEAATRVAKGYGRATDAFMPLGVQTEFVNSQLERQRVLMQAPENLSSGFNVQQFNSVRGPINLNGSTIMDRGLILDLDVAADFDAPVAPSKVAAEVADGEGKFADADIAGDLNYRVRVVGAKKSDSVPVTAKAEKAASEVSLDITIAGLYQSQPEYVEVFRQDIESGVFFRIGRIPFFQAERQADGFHLSFVDKNETLPGTADVFVGEINPRTIALYELMPIMRLPLAITNATISWSSLWYGAMALFAPKRWVRIKNVSYKVFGNV